MSYHRIDLHIHSTASDGDHTPSEVVSLALARRLDAIALTDHDTSNGLPAAMTAAEGTGLTVLPGLELATFQPDPTTPRGGFSVDFLGYCYDLDNAPLQDKLRHIREVRLTRAEQMVARLNELGMAISYERVRAIAGKGAVTRPHVAMALREAGHVASLQEAFDRYIADDGPAFVDRYRLSPPEAIRLLHAAGGAIVLAHPIRVPNLDSLLPEYIGYDLDGLEVYYPDHDSAFTRRMRVLARQYDLIQTGGTDFHREKGGVIRLGQQQVPPECVEQLVARAQSYRGD